ncbi:hypothetical protein COCON_G00170620 [Conger conger]|uniref:Uncharacterized protein n=1 Tax=Conger conger TaxID=82655 RepID=A0A9Q1D8G4_CONCO|nr:hypothetical protein COCON_G00170620 [Conger conger]
MNFRDRLVNKRKQRKRRMQQLGARAKIGGRNRANQDIRRRSRRTVTAKCFTVQRGD